VTEKDFDGRQTWSWSGSGAFTLANLDDDDGDGRADAADELVNGSADEADLAPLRVRLDATVLQRAKAANVSIEPTASAGKVRLFQRTTGGWRVVRGPLEELGPELVLGIESTVFASKDWDGFVTLKLEVRDADGKAIGKDAIQMRVAPFLVLPNSARTRTLYVSTGHPNYENAAFRRGLQAAATATDVQLVTFTTSSWKEMWMQDTMEIGYTHLPGRDPLNIVLGGLRGADSFGPRLLGPGMGFIQVGANRGISNGVDDWADWMGNLEVTPPVPGYPLGRVYYGRNTDTGVTMHPDVVKFLEAQKLQSPFWIDTGFLTIKHVDEIATFLPGPDGRPRLLIADTRRAEALVPAEAGPSNRRNQARLDKVLNGGDYADGASSRGLLAELGLSESQVVRMPVSYEGGHNVWSNPINSIFLNGVVVTGQHRVPANVAADIKQQMLAAGAKDVRFVDDNRYQDNQGNVHCATNTRKLPIVADFSKVLRQVR
jgi:protein-arginine deiminase